MNKPFDTTGLSKRHAKASPGVNTREVGNSERKRKAN